MAPLLDTLIPIIEFMKNDSKDRKRMLRVELYENIRVAVNKEGFSIRGAANKFKVHRRVVRWALMNAMPPERSASSVSRPKLGQYELIVRKWLEDDRSIAPKQRHTGTRVWQRLVDECQADVSVSAVRVMVKALRAE